MQKILRHRVVPYLRALLPVIPVDDPLQLGCQGTPFFFVQERSQLHLPALKGDGKTARVPGKLRRFQADPSPGAGAFPAFLRCLPAFFDSDDTGIYGNHLAYLAACQTQVKGDSQNQYFQTRKWQYGPETMQRICDPYTQADNGYCRINLDRLAP